MRATSQLGRLACRLNLAEEDVLIALRIHADGSGKGEGRFMTLGAFAGNDEVWEKFETDWNDILHNHSPRAEYIHMREANTLTKGFDWKLGWNTHKAFELSSKCLAYMSRVDKSRFRMFYCTVDLEAWEKVKRDGIAVPEPVEICSDFAMWGVLWWYVQQRGDDGIFNIPADSAHYFFDKDEPFEPKFKEKWTNEVARYEATEQINPWILIEQVSSVDMKKVPGVQAADVLAWSVNREKADQKIRPGQMYAEIMRQVIPSSSITYDETQLRRQFGG